jgi:hypothetical protein
VEALKEAGKRVGALGGDKPVDVVIHDAVAVDEYSFLFSDEGKALEVALLFEPRGKQFVPVNSPSDNMMGRAGDDAAGSASHGILNLLLKKVAGGGEKSQGLGLGPKGLSPRALGP